MKNDITLKSVLEFILAFMALITPSLYLVGYFFHSGLVNAYGLDMAIFSLSSEEYLINSFFFFSVLLFKFINWFPAHVKILGALFIAIFLSCFVIFGLVKKISSSKVAKKLFSRQTILLELWKGLSTNLWKDIFVVYIILCWVFLPYLAYLTGNKIALKRIDDFFSCELNEPGQIPITQYCVTILSEKGEVLRGMLLAESATHLAIWDGMQAVITPLEGKDITIIRGTKPNEF